MDINKPVKIRDTFNVALMDENGDLNGFHMEVYGDDSSFYKKLINKKKNEALHRKKDLTAEQITSQTMDLVASCVVSWDIKDGKAVAEVTVDAVKKVFKGFPWVYEQVIVEKGKRANFLGSAPKS